MPSDGFWTCLSLAVTRPASIAACARARLSNRPRSTSSMSARLRGGGCASLGQGQLDARAGAAPSRSAAMRTQVSKRGQVMPEIGGRLPWRHQRAAVQLERMNHHQIVAQSEILDGQAVGIDQAAILLFYCGEFAHAVGVERRIVAIAQAEFSASRHVAEFVDGAGIGARPAKRREIGDDGVGLDHHGLVALEDVERGIAGRHDRSRYRADRARSGHGARRFPPCACRSRGRLAGTHRGLPDRFSCEQYPTSSEERAPRRLEAYRNHLHPSLETPRKRAAPQMRQSR